MGRVVGRFYDEQGDAKPPLILAETQAERHRETSEAAAAAEQQGRTPLQCDVSWSAAKGGWVSCPEGMVPRRVLAEVGAGSEGSHVERCECFAGGDAEAAAGSRGEYEGCEADSQRCRTAEPEAGA